MILSTGRLAAAAVGTILACGGGTNRPPTVDTQPPRVSTREHLAEEPSKPDAPPSSLIGQRLPAWQATGWTNTTAPLEFANLRGKVIVVRFWTDTCPYCKASMPALEDLAKELADQPVVFVGLYHEKPRGRADASWSDAKQLAKDWGITFPIAHDTDWTTLRSWWLSTGDRSATSATFVFGPDGKVIHVHPGPVYFPSDDERHTTENRDFLTLRDAVRRALPKRD